MEPTFAEPQAAVKKPIGLPKGMSPRPMHPPAGNTPGATPSPMGNPRVNPYEYGPNSPDGYRAPRLQKRGAGGGYTGWDPRTETPTDRTIPRSKWQQPEQYRDPGHRWKGKSKVTGKDFRPRDIRIPTTKPNEVPRPGGGSRISKGAIFGAVIDELLNPRPTADGTAPDWDTVWPDPDPQHMPGDQTSLCGKGCVSGLSLGSINPQTGSIYEYQVLESADSGTSTTSQDFSGLSWTRSLGIFKIVSVSGYPDGFIQSPPIFLYNGVAGRTSYKDSNGKTYHRYKYWAQYKGKVPFLGKKWAGTTGYYWGDWRPSDIPYTPTLGSDGADFGWWTKLPSRIGVFYNCRVYFCDEEHDTEPTDPNDYDREEDDKMACKWLTENNQDVDQLELRDFEYQKFKGCQYFSNGQPDFFEDATINAPKGLGPSLVAILNTQSKMLSALCELPAPVPVVPDWMPLKWANVSKLVVLFAEERDGKMQPAKYQITIPHWIKSKSDTSAGDFSSYTKGQYQMIYEMVDGSKITINCQSEGWCSGVMTQLLRGVDSKYNDLPLPLAGKRGGKQLAEIDVFPVECRFYEMGAEQIKPVWTKRLR